MVFGRGKEKTEFKVEYLGGHSAFPKSKKCKMHLRDDHIELDKLPLKVPYDAISEMKITTSKELSVGRMLLTGMLAFAWKKKKKLLLVSYKDQIGMEQNLVFDSGDLEKIQPAIYNRVAMVRSA